MCLGASVAEVNKALRKALIGVRDGEEGISEPDYIQLFLSPVIDDVAISN